VLKRVQDIAAQLQKHDIFDEIKIYLDTNHDIIDTVDVTLHLKEKEKGLFQTKVNVGDNQAELVCVLKAKIGFCTNKETPPPPIEWWCRCT
jgi:outer membrane protein assembly factor BamA